MRARAKVRVAWRSRRRSRRGILATGVAPQSDWVSRSCVAESARIRPSRLSAKSASPVARRRVMAMIESTLASVFFTRWLSSRVSELRMEDCCSNQASAILSSTACWVRSRASSNSSVAARRPNMSVRADMAESGGKAGASISTTKSCPARSSGRRTTRPEISSGAIAASGCAARSSPSNRRTPAP